MVGVVVVAVVVVFVAGMDAAAAASKDPGRNGNGAETVALRRLDAKLGRDAAGGTGPAGD